MSGDEAQRLADWYNHTIASNTRAEREFDRKPWWKRFLLRVVFGRGFWIARHRDFYPL